MSGTYNYQGELIHVADLITICPDAFAVMSATEGVSGWEKLDDWELYATDREEMLVWLQKNATLRLGTTAEDHAKSVLSGRAKLDAGEKMGTEGDEEPL